LIVIFIYLMSLTVFVLDIIYVLVDPRIKIGGHERTLRTTVRGKNFLGGLFKKREEFSHPYNIQVMPSHIKRSSPDIKMKVFLQKVRQEFQNLAGTLRPVMKKPSAVIGMTIIALLLGLTIFAVIFIPYDTAVSLWSPVTGSVFNNPRLVQPVWTNLFRRYAYPLTIQMQSGDVNVVHQELFAPNTVGLTKYTFRFDYPYSTFPQDLSIRLNTKFKTLPSLVTFTWITPDGRSYELGKITVNNDKLFIVNQDLPGKLTRLFGLEARVNALGKEAFVPVEVLFASPDIKKIETVKGTYQLVASVQNFEKDATVTISMILYGKVFGLAGTDLNRRDLLVPLLWGIPVALVFGVVGATLTILLSLFIAAVSAWKGGWIDSLIQRISEINLVIPIIPFGIMVFYLFKESIWAVLAVFVLFNIFGASLKNFRAALIQIKEAPYIEAALSYGASDWRIIWHYLVPHLLPMVIPQLIIMIPAYIFLEASMAFFGVVDPILPTWGKLIYEAFTGGALHGDYYWILEPVGMIVLVGLAFTLLGSALDDVLNPRLRKF
jgi:peptide/nickel transport system permease protein